MVLRRIHVHMMYWLAVGIRIEVVRCSIFLAIYKVSPLTWVAYSWGRVGQVWNWKLAMLAGISLVVVVWVEFGPIWRILHVRIIFAFYVGGWGWIWESMFWIRIDWRLWGKPRIEFFYRLWTTSFKSRGLRIYNFMFFLKSGEKLSVFFALASGE
jgi:hypothetical protein